MEFVPWTSEWIPITLLCNESLGLHIYCIVYILGYIHTYMCIVLSIDGHVLVLHINGTIVSTYILYTGHALCSPMLSLLSC